jgi:hypothetical protein
MDEKKKDYSSCNAEPVLAKLNEMIARGVSVSMRSACYDLSIFDWWVERLSVTNMKKMRVFLKEAIKLGYKGYVCFKVGASHCANGMWAHRKESENGYSPDGDCLYRSFTPDYNYWAWSDGETWYPDRDDWDSLKTVKQLEEAMAAHEAAKSQGDSGEGGR